jgi:uncharacterized tellurite resistance protein B-like protein
MGFYIRKSVRVGPLRFNLSKSGIGVSTGVPGFRVGVGPRGTYVHMGRGGLYYRQTLSTPTALRGRLDRPVIDDPVQPPHTHGPMNAVGSGSVTEMVDTSSAAILSEIEQKRQRIIYWPFMLVTGVVGAAFLLVGSVTLWLTLPCLIVLFLSIVAVYQYDQLTKCVVLMYDLEGPSLDSYQKLFAAVNSLQTCGAVWHITARGDVYDPKYHAGAGQLVNRRRLSVGLRNPPYVRTNLCVPFLPFGQHSLYLLPDRILVYASSGVGAVAYNTLSLSINTSRFIEDGAVPHDAAVVDHTWRYVNKSGGPDRRFNNNRQLPICNYEELRITSSTGVGEILQVSRLGVSAILQSAVSGVVASIRQAEAAEEERKRLEEQRRQQISLEREAAVPKGGHAPPNHDPTPQQLHAAFFDILCCIMVADGRVSTREKAAIRDVMSRIRSGWSDDDCNTRIESFIEEIGSRGYAHVLQRSTAKVAMFRQTGRASTLLKCIDMIANVDGELSQRERVLCDRIRGELGASARPTQN